MSIVEILELNPMSNKSCNSENLAKLRIVVVVYNKTFDESSSLIALQKQQFSTKFFYEKPLLFIYDNSPVSKISNDDIVKLSEKYSIEFFCNDGNRPLSDIYASAFKLSDIGEYILLLDDDTNLPLDYISGFYIQSLSDTTPSVVFVPKVNVAGSLISPYRRFFVFSKPINNAFYGINGRISAINSGIIIKKSDKLDDFNYPQYATFYGTDTVLFDFFNHVGYKVFVLAVTIEHDLSFHPSQQLRNISEIFAKSCPLLEKTL